MYPDLKGQKYGRLLLVSGGALECSVVVHCGILHSVQVSSDIGQPPVQPPVRCSVTSTLPRKGLPHKHIVYRIVWTEQYI